LFFSFLLTSGTYTRRVKTSSLSAAKIAERLPFEALSVSSFTTSSFGGNHKHMT
jgi:hypothetical protein